ncbi:MAG: cobalamin-dependent protein [Verrucomicrobiota bacterium]
MDDAPLHPQASRAVLGQWSEITAALVDRKVALCPQRGGPTDHETSLQDAGYHLSFLAQALALNHPAMFVDHVAWAKVMLIQRKVPPAELTFHFECLAEVLEEQLPAESGALASGFVRAAVRAMPEMPEDLPTCLHQDEPLSPLAYEYFAALQRGERQAASRLIGDAVAAGTPVKELYLQVFQPVQHELGRLWQTNRLTVAQEHYCTAATRDAISRLDPHLVAPVKNGHTLLATCVSGEQHEVGVRMVADFCEMDGWKTYLLGASTPHTDVLSSLTEQQADLLAISAAMPYHVEAVRELIRSVRADPGCGRVMILAGGFPFNRDPDLWRNVGADGSALDAQGAVDLANRLMAERVA